VYRDAPNHALYQGDLLVAPLVVVASDDPQIITLEPAPEMACQACGAKQEAPKNARRYRPAGVRFKKKEPIFEGETEDLVATVRPVLAVLLSHSCDIDRQGRVRLAVVQEAQTFLSEKQLAALREGKPGNFSLFYLPPTDGLPEAIVNLDLQFFLAASALGQARKFRSRAGREEPALAPYREVVDSRVASLDDEGLKKLYQALLIQQTRPGAVDVQYDGFEPGAAVFFDDPGRPQRDELPARGWWWPKPRWLRAATQLDLLPSTSEIPPAAGT
jgi:hypothetical protein